MAIRRARPDPRADLDDELAHHRDATIDDLRAGGFSADAAADEAARRFGSLRRHRRAILALDRSRAARPIARTIMTLLFESFRAVSRDLRRAPGFACAVIAMLTLGLGVNAITLGLVDRLVLSGPAGLVNPNALRRIVMERRGPRGDIALQTAVSYPDLVDLQQSRQLTGAAGESRTTVLVGDGRQVERIRAVLVTANYFSLLGVAPGSGRFFTDDESRVQGARLAVLGHAYWQRAFGGDPSAVGRTLAIDGQQYAIVGVTPAGFTGSSVALADVFLPLEAASDVQVSGPWRAGRGLRWLSIVGRLAPGASDASAAAELSAIVARTAETDTRVRVAGLNPVSGPFASDDAGLALVVSAVAFAVLAITFSNVANLFFARAIRRSNQYALRLAVGCSRARLLLTEAAEGMWLAGFGAAAAVGVASVGAPAVRALLFPRVAWVDGRVNVPLLLALGVAAVVLGGAVASLPLWSPARTSLTGISPSGARVSSRRTRTQVAMLVVQASLSIVLLVGAGLFTRSLSHAHGVDLGLDTEHVLIVSVDAGGRPVDRDFADMLRARVQGVPGVTASAMSAGTVPFVSSWGARLTVPGVPSWPRLEDGGPYIDAVTDGYFTAVGTRIVRGRAFGDSDRMGAERVAIVNETMARLIWPGQEAIGQCLHIGNGTPPCWRVVGIAANTRRQSIVEGDSYLYYVPLAQADDQLQGIAHLVLRVADGADSAAVSDAVRQRAFEIDPSLRLVTVSSIDDIVSPQLRTWRLGAGLFGTFALLALVVAMMGLYSVAAFDVEGRRRELAVRAALGATSSKIARQIVKETMRTTAAGLLGGLAVSWLAAPALARWLYGVEPGDLAVFGSALVAMTMAGIIASVVPALRAARVRPASILR
jgi:predicted permease